MRGPVLYCLESKDLDEDINIDNVRIPSNIEFDVVKSDLPFDIKKLEGKGLYYDNKRWDEELYRQLETEKMSELSIELIPYFVWNNRGPVAMSV